MRLLTHNMLSSNIKGVVNGFLSESRSRKSSRSRSTSIQISSRTCSPRSNGSPLLMLLELWAMPSFLWRPRHRCQTPMIFCNDSTMHFQSCIWRKALLFAQRLAGDSLSIKVFPICFFTKTRSEFEILQIPLFSNCIRCQKGKAQSFTGPSIGYIVDAVMNWEIRAQAFLCFCLL